MNKVYLLFILILFVQVSYANKNDSESCQKNQVKLSVFAKNDSDFISKNCEISPDNQFVESYLIRYDTKKNLSKINGRSGNGAGVKLIAVSVYKKINKPPVLIELYSEKYCCYPEPSGNLYTINLYELHNKKNGIGVNSITDILGDNSSGLDGVSDGYMSFKLKNIASIKKWLDKNYK